LNILLEKLIGATMPLASLIGYTPGSTVTLHIISLKRKMQCFSD
jgi:hypothetical protein